MDNVHIKPHKQLVVWQTSMDLVTDIYKVLKSFPDSEKYCMVQQMQRCAVSVPSNISEGAARRSTKELLQFSYIARGSLSELDTYLEISARLGYVDDKRIKDLTQKLNRVGMLLNGLIKSLR